MTTTETAAVMPAVFGLMLFAVQAGLAAHAAQRADGAADRAVAAAQAADGSTLAGEDAAVAYLARAPVEDASVTVTRSGDRIRATVTGVAAQVVPGLTWHVNRSAEATTERFVPEPERR